MDLKTVQKMPSQPMVQEHSTNVDKKRKAKSVRTTFEEVQFRKNEKVFRFPLYKDKDLGFEGY